MTVLTRADIRAAVSAVLPNAEISVPFDRHHARASHDWVVEKFAPEMPGVFKFLFGDDWRKWAPAKDCDKYSRAACVHAHAAHSRAQGLAKDAPEGCTVGYICYCVAGDPNQGHCINIIITERGVEFFEPQTRQFVTLTAAERDSAWLAQF